MRCACARLRHQQVLAVVGKLHVGARDFDAGARAGILLISRLCKQGFGERHIGLRGFDIGIGLDGGQIGARDLRGHLLGGAIGIGARRGDAHF